MNEIEIQAGLPQTADYLYARKIGNQLHVAGQVPVDSSGNIVGVAAPYRQAQQCLVNLALLLNCHDFEKTLTAHGVRLKKRIRKECPRPHSLVLHF
jgi:enamine deaminase RidA (YjgF/YER057c/UK114 family)